MQTSAEPTGGMRLREFGDGGEELDENDLWDTMDGHDADDVSATSDDDDEGVALEAADEDAREGAREDAREGAREDAREVARAVPSSVPTTYGSLPAWKSSLPRPIIHAAASPSARASAGPLRDADDVSSSLGVPEPPPGFVPPHIYASTYSTYSSTSGAGYMDTFLNGQLNNGEGGIGSVVSGRGHTLKGRDALKMRTAVMRQTGFLEREPTTPGAVAPPARTKTPESVRGFVTREDPTKE